MTSYELAIWDGARPANDVVALTTYLDLYEQYIDTESLAPPSRRIRNFLQALLTRWPETDNSPWVGTPLSENARGPLLYLTVAFDKAKEVMDFVVPLTTRNRLVCFDPQQECLLL